MSKQHTSVTIPESKPEEQPQSQPQTKKPCDWQKTSKAFSSLLALALITLGVLNLVKVFKISTPLEYIISVYYALFGLLLLTTIIKMKSVLKYFGFIYTYFGSGIFDFFLASMVWTQTGIYNFILAICFCVLAFLNLALSCTQRSEYQDFSEEMKEELISEDFKRGMRAASKKK